MFTIITNGHLLTGIECDGTPLEQGKDFAVNGSQVRFNQSYLEGLATGTYSYNITFATCPDVVVTITVNNDDVVTTTTVTTDTTTTTTTTTTTSGTGTEKDDVLYGDTNLDGVLSMIDIVYLNKFISGSMELNDQQLANAQCYISDPEINGRDANALMQRLAEQIKVLPVKD